MVDLQKYIDNDYVVAVLTIVLIAYMSHVRVELPDAFSSLFKNDIFRVVFLSLLLMTYMKKSPTVSIIIALFFVIVLGRIMADEAKENFQMVKKIKQIKNRKH